MSGSFHVSSLPVDSTFLQRHIFLTFTSRSVRTTLWHFFCGFLKALYVFVNKEDRGGGWWCVERKVREWTHKHTKFGRRGNRSTDSLLSNKRSITGFQTSKSRWAKFVELRQIRRFLWKWFLLVSFFGIFWTSCTMSCRRCRLSVIRLVFTQPLATSVINSKYLLY